MNKWDQSISLPPPNSGCFPTFYQPVFTKFWIRASKLLPMPTSMQKTYSFECRELWQMRIEEFSPVKFKRRFKFLWCWSCINWIHESKLLPLFSLEQETHLFTTGRSDKSELRIFFGKVQEAVQVSLMSKFHKLLKKYMLKGVENLNP